MLHQKLLHRRGAVSKSILGESRDSLSDLPNHLTKNSSKNRQASILESMVKYTNATRTGARVNDSQTNSNKGTGLRNNNAGMPAAQTKLQEKIEKHPLDCSRFERCHCSQSTPPVIHNLWKAEKMQRKSSRTKMDKYGSKIFPLSMIDESDAGNNDKSEAPKNEETTKSQMRDGELGQSQCL